MPDLPSLPSRTFPLVHRAVQAVVVGLEAIALSLLLLEGLNGFSLLNLLPSLTEWSPAGLGLALVLVVGLYLLGLMAQRLFASIWGWWTNQNGPRNWFAHYTQLKRIYDGSPEAANRAWMAVSAQMWESPAVYALWQGREFRLELAAFSFGAAISALGVVSLRAFWEAFGGISGYTTTTVYWWIVPTLFVACSGWILLMALLRRVERESGVTEQAKPPSLDFEARIAVTCGILSVALALEASGPPPNELGWFLGAAGVLPFVAVGFGRAALQEAKRIHRMVLQAADVEKLRETRNQEEVTNTGG